MNSLDITTPKIFELHSVLPNEEYFIKDEVGFGSRGSYKCLGNEIPGNLSGKLIQQVCHSPEITVDTLVVNKKVYTLARERIEVKAGVCVKARVFHNEEIEAILQKISDNIELPIISCVQFMTDAEGKWSLTDFNLRPGAATAISSCSGFKIVQAALSLYLNEKLTQSFNSSMVYTPPHLPAYSPLNEKYVMRVYQEIITTHE